MLIKLKLKNIALIEIIEINFEKGLNILTGDSGSGKSLILDSLNSLFGGTNIPLNHLIRPGKDDCLIEATFSPSHNVNEWLIDNGFSDKSKEFKIRRKSYKKNSKILTKYFLNEKLINKKLLEKLGLMLIDFVGQSDSFLFESNEYRRLIIDDLGCKNIDAINLEVKNTWKEFERLRFLLLEKMESIRKQKENNYAIKEMFNILDKANLTSSDEIIELESQENLLSNTFEINNSIQSILMNLSNCTHDESSVAMLLSQSIKNINRVVQYDAKIQAFRERLLNIQIDVENLIFEINSYIQEFEKSDLELEDVQKRLFYLRNLERTFSLPLSKLIKKRDQLKTFFDDNICDKEIKELEFQINSLQKCLDSLFQRQSSERKKIAEKLQNSVTGILKNLGLPNAKFFIEFEKCKASEEGIENINFLFSANPDQKLASLSKVISGGEMSRFLLAIKSSISKKANTFFLDEIDNGLSGKSLFSLVELIKQISNEKQVLCITHQPFLASVAKAHFKVTKNVINGITFTSVSKLDTKEERNSELRELIGVGFYDLNDYSSLITDKTAA